ncbi:MAG: ABC transporter ATP-binding protein [Gammaproteobacteria bacterium]
MIKISDLAMSYPVGDGRLNVLNGVDIRIERGQSVAIVGPSGSGKTSLLSLLAGLETPDRGAIELDGVDITRLDSDSLADLRRDKLGIIFQSFHLVPSLTALGNVSLPLEIAARPSARDQASQMLEKVGLTERKDHFPTQLSGGEQQRVAIARALVHAPKLVLADEPTGNLDLDNGARIIDLLFGLSDDAGSTLVLVTHDEAIARRCTRVLRLRDGRLEEDAAHAVPA